MPREDREPDELFEIRTNFYTGNYQQTINEATKLKVCRRRSLLSLILLSTFSVRFQKIFKSRRTFSCTVRTSRRRNTVSCSTKFAHRRLRKSSWPFVHSLSSSRMNPNGRTAARFHISIALIHRSLPSETASYKIWTARWVAMSRTPFAYSFMRTCIT